MALYVNNEKIENSDINAEIERLRFKYEQVFEAETPDEQNKLTRQLNDWARENIIERVLFRQAARREITGVEDDQQKVQRLQDKLIAAVDVLGEDEIRQYYDSNAEQFKIPLMIRASHIIKNITPKDNLDDLKEKMQVIRNQINSDSNFSEFAVKYSDTPGNAGDLGYFCRGRMVPEFDEVVFKMNVGDISDVFITQFGFHIVKVTDKKPASIISFDNAKEKIKALLIQDNQQKALDNFIDAEKQNAVIQEKDE